MRLKCCTSVMLYMAHLHTGVFCIYVLSSYQPKYKMKAQGLARREDQSQNNSETHH